MPGWYSHLTLARKAITSLATNAGALEVINNYQGGPNALVLTSLANDHPAYFALGAIGPDLFFMLPDFTPPNGHSIYKWAHLIDAAYRALDETLIGPFTDEFTAIAHNAGDILNNATAGLASEVGAIAATGMAAIKDYLIILASQQYDFMGLLGSGVQKGYDEQVFYWSDMLHYRKTYEFPAHLWDKAVQAGNARFKAFALGWMTHVAVDVTGHGFVNEKCGGPYRLHWQRHHIIESHVDAQLYLQEYGSQQLYRELTTAAMHLWLAFDDAGESYLNYLDPADPRPPYLPGDDTPAFLDRRGKWDVDSEMPADLAEFLAEALREVYNVSASGAPNGQWSPLGHPTILNSLNVGNTDGYPTAEDITITYGWLYHYVKLITTDFYRFVEPKPPTVYNTPSGHPQPPLTGASPQPAGSGTQSSLANMFHLILHILALILYWIEVVLWELSLILNNILSPLTYPLREEIYEYILLPLYNVEMLFHWYLSLLGYAYPLATEISPALTTLGQGYAYGSVQAALNSLTGNLGAAVVLNEPSGLDREGGNFPRDVVTDPQSVVTTFLNGLIPGLSIPPHGACGNSEAPSAFLAPWEFPTRDQQNDPIPTERSLSPEAAPAPVPTVAGSPYKAGTTGQSAATALLGNAPGDPATRTMLEGAQNERDSAAVHVLLAQGKHLGDPANYAGYVIAKLTRNTGPIANFNLDADRGYGYLCWDWVRTPLYTGVPNGFENFPDPHCYKAPLRPGFGWCCEELSPDGLCTPPQGGCTLPQPPLPTDPAIHRPEENPPAPVKIRYIDREAR